MQRPKGIFPRILLWAFFLFFGFSLQAQSAREVAVEISAVNTANNHTELRWKSDTGVIRYFVYKRPHADSNWVLLDSAVSSTLKFTDTQSRIGSSIEYRVAKKKNNFSFLGNGYIKAGFNIPAQSDKGIVLLIIDSNYVVPAKQDIQDYIAQLQNEGFEVVKKSVLRTESVSNIKSWIFQQYLKDTQRLKCVLLMGHVPVPYSGDISPDGHTDHRGAWPADNYYGSFYTSWTDITVNRTTASRPANRNTPGDGKFDLSRLNPVGTTWKNTKRYQLPVGRIDFFDMPAFGSDTMLLKRYIKKNLAFRTKQVSFSAKGLVDDNFGYFAGEAFASGGYRNFSTFFGDSIVDADYAGTGNGMKTTKYLWSYGCGGGSYTSCSGVSNSTAMAQDSLLNPFTMVFGSYFGDWDNQNNFLRAPIASKGWGLAAAWAGRPYWMMHEAALGAPLYQCVKSTYNCTNVYSVGSSGSGVHVALMGDPTLRVFPVANLQQVTATNNCEGIATIQWQKSTDQADSIIIEIWQNNQWNPFGTTVGIDTQFVKTLSQGKHQISLREKKLMQSASGTWWDVGARSIVLLSVNLSDTPKITSNANRLCPGDTFTIAASVGYQSKIVEWKQDGKSLGNQDSLWSLVSQGQGNIKLHLLVQTDSGCLSADSLVINAIASDKLSWTATTDSTISVRSSLKLPISWYLNDTLLIAEQDTILKIKRSGLYHAMTLTEGLCGSRTDTLRYTLPVAVMPLDGFRLTALCDEKILVGWQNEISKLDSILIYEKRNGQTSILQTVSNADTAALIVGKPGKTVLGVGGKKQVKVVSGLRWDMAPIVWDSLVVSARDTVVLRRQNDTQLVGISVRKAPLKWYRNDTLLFVDSVNYTPRESGSFRVCTIMQDSCVICSDTVNFVYKRVVGSKMLHPHQQYSIYPNPVSTHFIINETTDGMILSWQVFDLKGIVLIEGKGNTVDVSNLTKGCYYLLVEQRASLLFLKQ
jgi:hypothetical protein